jgi:hypothetical protein
MADLAKRIAAQRYRLAQAQELIRTNGGARSDAQGEVIPSKESIDLVAADFGDVEILDELGFKQGVDYGTILGPGGKIDYVEIEHERSKIK